MEKLAIVCSEKNTHTGEVELRSTVIENGLWCRSTNVYVLNRHGEVLCHQRAMEKERMPGVWSTHLGGHVAVGETYDTNAQKELEEEIGIAVPENSIIPWRTTKIESSHLWVKEYVVLLDRDIAEMIPQPGEIDALAWMRPEDILAKEIECPDTWCAGTHDFTVEYHCLKAALAVAAACGRIATPTPEIRLDTWHPLGSTKVA